MGNSYAILVWDDWGGGLVRVNARLLCEGLDMYGNPRNSWSCDADITDEQIAATHNLKNYKHYLILRD